MNTTLSEAGVEAALMAYNDTSGDSVTQMEAAIRAYLGSVPSPTGGEARYRQALINIRNGFKADPMTWASTVAFFIDTVLGSVPSPTGGVAEGFKLVPVEPTPEMLKAAEPTGHISPSFLDAGDDFIANPRDVWASMLAASPSPPTAAGAGEAVAWRYRNRYPLDPDLDAKSIARDGWEIVRHKPTWANEPDGTFDIQPLYAAPHHEVREGGEATAFAAGIERAARWHDIEGAAEGLQAVNAAHEGDDARRLMHELAQLKHKDYAACIRALSQPREAK